jgi:uncharacterized OB-fold protein
VIKQPGPDLPVHPEIFSVFDPATREFRLGGSRCRQCDELFFPRRLACPRCHSAKAMVPEDLPSTGQIYALTHVGRPAVLYQDSYVLALVDLDDGPRVLAQVKGDSAKLRIGDPVRLVIEPLFHTRNTQPVWGYRFELATG